MDKNTEITMSLYIESKRSSIISFASYCVCPDNPVTREQFKRVFRLYAEYEEIIKDNDLQNGEVDIAIRIIREAYENNLRNRSFVARSATRVWRWRAGLILTESSRTVEKRGVEANCTM